MSSKVVLRGGGVEPDYRVKIATLAGLFHDIAKTVSVRGHAEKSAEVFGGLLVLGKEGEIHDAVWDIINNHSRGGYVDEYRDVFNAVKLADWIASSFRDTDEETWTNLDKVFGLISPFPFEQDGVLLFSTEKDLKNGISYRELEGKLQGFRQRSPNALILHIPDLLHTLYKEFFAFVDDTRDRDIPLPVHLHLTAALASVFVSSKYFRAVVGDRCFRVKEETRSLEDPNELAVRVLGMDIHRIQKFVSATTETGAIRRVAGKSYLVTILGHTIPALIALLHGVTPANVLVSSGGKAYLVLPPSLKEEELRELETRINEDLWRRGIEVVVSIEWEDVNWKDLVEKQNRVLLEALLRVNEKLKATTRRPFLETRLINFDHAVSGDVCPGCGRPVKDRIERKVDGEQWCLACYISVHLRDFLAGKTSEVPNEEILHVELGGTSLSVAFGNEDENTVAVFTLDESIPKPAHYVTDKEYNILSFVDLLRECGAERSVIAILKLDGDSMGKIISNILEREEDGGENRERSAKELTKYLAFSKALFFFFERYVPTIAKKYMLHLVYAGGDDLLAVGCFSDILSFLEEVIEEFEKYKRNGSRLFMWSSDRDKSLLPTISAAVLLFPIKYKFLWALEEVEDLLEEAKNWKKSEESFTKGGLIVVSPVVVGDTRKFKEYMEMAGEIESLENLKDTAMYKVLELSLDVAKEGDIRKYSYLYTFFKRREIEETAPVKHLRSSLMEALTKKSKNPADRDFLLPWMIVRYKRFVGGEQA